jgi:hypothetical protein
LFHGSFQSLAWQLSWQQRVCHLECRWNSTEVRG